MGMFHGGHRTGGDLPIGGDHLKIPDRLRFDRTQGQHSTKYVFPLTFHPGVGRIALLNRSLLPLYGLIGGLQNCVEHEKEYLERSDACEFAKDTLRKGIRDLKDELREFTMVASSLLGEIVAIGGNYHIPEDLQGVVVRSHRINRCLEHLANSYLPELYTVPHTLPAGKCKLSVKEIISKRSWETTSVGDCNSVLGKIFSELAFYMNRIEYLEEIYGHCRFFPGSDHKVLQGNTDEAFNLFEISILVIKSKITTHSDSIFMMPEKLRDITLSYLVKKRRDPIQDVSILYDRTIQAFKAGFADVVINHDNLSNFTTLIGTQLGKVLIESAGGILELARSTPAEIVAMQDLQTHFVFQGRYAVVRDRARMCEELAKMLLNALYVDILNASRDVRTSYYGEWLCVHAQALANLFS